MSEGGEGSTQGWLWRCPGPIGLIEIKQAPGRPPTVEIDNRAVTPEELGEMANKLLAAHLLIQNLTGQDCYREIWSEKD